MAENSVSENVYIGIDLNNEKAMVSLFHAGMREPETIAAHPGTDLYAIPAVVYRSGSGKYYYGEEAIKRKDRTDGAYFENLYEEALLPENTVYRNILVQFLKRLIRFRERYECCSKMALYLAVAVPKINDAVLDLFAFVRSELSIVPEQFQLMDYGESFFALVYSQDRSVWLHDTALFECDGRQISMRLLHTDAQGKVRRVTSETYAWTVPHLTWENPQDRDAFFAKTLQEAFARRAVSGVYLVGEGFEGSWMQDSLQMLGKHRRVFQGDNLFTSGACLAGYRNVNTQGWHFYYDCAYKLKGEVRLAVTQNGQTGELILAGLGENYFAPTKTYYLLLAGDPVLNVSVRTRGKETAREFEFSLDYVPEREAGSVRLSVQAQPVSGTEVWLRLADDGFGELFESTGKEWRFLVPIDPE